MLKLEIKLIQHLTGSHNRLLDDKDLTDAKLRVYKLNLMAYG